MALEKITDIEGLDTFEDHDITDDTHPEATRVWFEVVAEEMPYLTAHNPEGTVVIKNFVYRCFEQELGRTASRRRIKDTVEFSEKDGKWIVKKLAAGKWSDIKRHKNEWNAFNRGQKPADIGTPLSVLFRADPARVLMFKRHGVETVERCALLADDDCMHIGMGASDARGMARKFLARAKENASGVHANAKIQELQAELASRDARLADLEAKFAELLSRELEAAAPKRGRKAQAQAVEA